MTTATALAAGQYMGGDPTTIDDDLLTIINHVMTHSDRSLQVEIGPSEIGIDCPRCLVHKLAGTPEERDAAWLPAVGTAVHAWLEEAVVRYGTIGGVTRYLTECRLHVGDIAGKPIHGNCDVFDTFTGTVVDYKIVGATTLRSAKANGASQQYRIQQHLYGKGWEDAGYTVQAVSVWYLPRNDAHLGNAVLWQEPYDRGIAEEALRRCDTIAGAIAAAGLDTVLANTAPHRGGFSCKRMPDADVWSKLTHPTNSGGTTSPVNQTAAAV